MLKLLDYWLDRVTMYRLLLYYLIALLVIAVGLADFGLINIKPIHIIAGALFLTAVCWLTNKAFAYVYEAPTNIESAYLTALILALIITPAFTSSSILFMTVTGILAISSKFLLAIGKKHIFNPAAIAVVLTALFANQSASWWVGNPALLVFVVIGGLLIIRKVQRTSLVVSFLLSTIITTSLIAWLTRSQVLIALQRTALHSPLFFLAFVMLTEPITSPTENRQRLTYGALVGILLPPQIHIFGLYTTPELALSVGNIYAYIVNPKLKLMPKLKQKIVTGPDTIDFIFDLDKSINFKPGQYMEWTLSHNNADARGNRRYLTLASSPTENNVRIGVKFYDNGSSYKQALLKLKDSDLIAAAQLGGDFVLPKDTTKKLVFIAGGIGITPFRSMIKYLLDINQHRDIVLLYSEKRLRNFIYRDVFLAASQKLGLRSVYTLTDETSLPANWQGQVGKISPEMIQATIPDYGSRLFYISGPHSLVTDIKDALLKLNVSHNQIKTDYFPGYA